MKAAKSVIAYPTLVVLFIAGAAAGAGRPDFASRRALVTQADLGRAFSEVAVKANRPMPWPIFTAHRYQMFKGNGKIAGGDLGKDPDAAIWLAILDTEFRTQGRLIFVTGGKVPGVSENGWISLKDFENEIMPKVMFSKEAFANEETAEAVRDLVARATALHALSWEGLLVVPGDAAAGWRPAWPEGPFAADINRLAEAYKKKDAAAMNSAATALARALISQTNYPSRTKLRLEVYLEKFRILKIAFGLYLLSSLLLFVWAATGTRAIATAGIAAAATGFIFLTAGIVVRTVIAGYLPTTGMFEYLLTLSWAAVLFFLIFYAATRQPFLGVIVMPVAFLAIVVASLFPKDIEGQLIPALQSWWLTVHVSLAALGEGAFAVGFAAAAFRLFRSDRPAKFIPSRERLAALEYRPIALGFPLFTIGSLVAGAIWAQKAWSVWWSWDPKETASLVVFLVAAAYLHARRLRGWQGTRSAALAILVFVTAVLTLFSNLLFGGLHSYGV